MTHVLAFLAGMVFVWAIERGLDAWACVIASKPDPISGDRIKITPELVSKAVATQKIED